MLWKQPVELVSSRVREGRGPQRFAWSAARTGLLRSHASGRTPARQVGHGLVVGEARPGQFSAGARSAAHSGGAEAGVETSVEEAPKRGLGPHHRGFDSGLPRSSGERRSPTGS